MIKNEEELIRVTLDTVKEFPLTIIFDTGSTDSTLSIIRNEYPSVKVFEGVFVDFATSRNEMLRLADEFTMDMEQPYYLTLDAGDEVNIDWSFVERGTYEGYLVQQTWECTTLTQYYNIKLFKARTGFKYVGKVHEYLQAPENASTKRIPWLKVYQDRRRKGCESSAQRWHRDLELLLDEVLDDEGQSNERAWFYLAQTYECLDQFQEALGMYKRRSRMMGFYEEKFIATYRVGCLYEALEYPWEKAFIWYMKAFNLIERVEPLLKIAKGYINKNNFKTAWWYLNIACALEYPWDNILFVDVNAYDYERWHLMGIVAWYCGKYTQGKDACERAIKQKDLTIDKSNLMYYR